ncbi:MAG: ABC transporter permease, partial [Deltaproteobacteria bacterium]|nr:ABC transporter permease [Deltaproteobacteria bacterium]
MPSTRDIKNRRWRDGAVSSGPGLVECAAAAFLTTDESMFLSLFAAPLRHRALLRQFMRREVLGRYRGSLLGLGWAFVLPLAMLAVYTFVFAGVFRLRWPGAEEAGGVVFALRLFAGLIVFQLVAEVLGRAPTLVTAQPNLVKKVVFPLELLPFVSLGVALFHFAVSVALLLVAVLLVEQ